SLEACRGRIVNVELKSDLPEKRRLVEASARAIRRADEPTRSANIIVSSFHPALVLGFGVFAPRTRRAMLIGRGMTRGARASSTGAFPPVGGSEAAPPFESVGVTAVALGMRPFIQAVHLEESLASRARMRRLHALGLRVAVWTVNDPSRAAMLARDG